ncbi:RNA polymerase sigma factor [Oceaniglobus ichthyenteri]|uniref:RNA polymerase sigma factor n=1 Tax=Oceaniglobus ichthyenteri TaxID=2136177 RepID=UPI000D3B931E|nr:RNA polymerase sigma factor [Oceaniglobus ichthyenteri]
MQMPRAPLDTCPDAALLVAYGRGDTEAARVLTARLAPRVLGFATRMLKGDRAEAEDVTQEAMLRLWKMAPSWEQGAARVSTWLFRVTSNLCLDRLRKSGRATPLDDADEPEDDAPTVLARLETAQRHLALETALDQLSDRQRQAVILRHIEGMANPDIAQVMDISTEAVESLTARGKRALTAILAPQREELGYD